MTGVPSCCLPHCQKPIEQIGQRYAELRLMPYDRRRTELEEAEYIMLSGEIYGRVQRKDKNLSGNLTSSELAETVSGSGKQAERA